MMHRTEALKTILAHAGDDSCLISPLGYITRDLFALTPDLRERCFYCMGSMGSVLPLTLGIALARPSLRVYAIEGDGSLLMNLGGLVTLHRYAPGNVSVMVFDNHCYESTGGQRSQPYDLKLEEVCWAAGLNAFVASDYDVLEDFVRNRERNGVMVVKVGLSPPSKRVDEDPQMIANRFASWLQNS